ncbi:hypothetical protein Trco_007105 [Trichoderma cornu-damae]|uniref:Uncharacterized protein n=1 Tax=Trichoderma cornu-damae TaxID=654480 RepID=A0A9P8QMJ8_9HYPO|nr:hypothetical protein Trco_007105 [Trichoderma cornu-damae]
MGNPIVDLGLSCPKAGRFYICDDQPTRFVGCCTINPCTTHDGLCPDEDIQPASFSPDAYDQILAQECLDPGFLWYTCRDSSPPFLGCCSQMGCEASGCPFNNIIKTIDNYCSYCYCYCCYYYCNQQGCIDDATHCGGHN